MSSPVNCHDEEFDESQTREVDGQVLEAPCHLAAESESDCEIAELLPEPPRKKRRQIAPQMVEIPDDFFVEVMTIRALLEEVWLDHNTPQKMLTFLMQASTVAEFKKWKKESQLCKKIWLAISKKWESDKARNSAILSTSFLTQLSKTIFSMTSLDLLSMKAPDDFITLLRDYRRLNSEMKSSSLPATTRTTTSFTRVPTLLKDVDATVDEFRRKSARRVISASNVTRYFLQNSAIYLCSGGRQIIFFQIAGREGRRVCGTVEDLSDRALLTSGSEELVENGDDPDSIFDTFYRTCDVRTTPGINRERPERTGESSRNGQPRDPGVLLFLKAHPFSPVQLVLDSKVWMESKYRFIIDRRKLDPFFNVFNYMFIKMSTQEIFEYVKDIECSYGCTLTDPFDYYYSIDESVNILNELLLYQMAKDVEIVKQFLLELYDVLERRVPKINCFAIFSPPSAGKNYFIDAVLCYYFNFGQIHDFNKHCNFPLQDCVNRRVLYWNEPNFEPAATETLKMLLGGDNCPARIKYLSDKVITRTPVIITGNYDCFPRDSAFDHRMKRYHWREAPYLKDLRKKPYPMSFYHLLKLYNIIE
ncbi:uncharacterized protein [Onthophagus taurus]|uniref:uncharacterized protein n=1 Tax=Onthophagus taurus TaxID=166361 RepID=UPI0039BE7580